MFRQGDIILIPVKELPEDLKKENHLVIAEGEVTGHLHEVKGVAELFTPKDFEELQRRFLSVVEESELTHPEHENITLSPGLFEVRRQREYTPEGDAWVAD